MLGKTRRLAILAEGHFNATDAKSAVGMLRYRPDEVVAVIDSTRAGRTAQSCAGVGGDVPVVAGLEAAAALEPDTLLIGIAPQGGALPEPWRKVVAEALLRGWDVVSGLHQFLADDPELATLAESKGCRILDVRRPPAGRPIAAARAARVEALVVLTVGSDCNVGKMTTALEIRADLERRGARTAFVATGQTGIFIADRGVSVDAVAADFVAGVVEEMVVEAARDADIVLVEGQGALHHPAYSGVALSLLHGACPDAMVLCHVAGRTHIRVPDAGPSPRIRSLSELIRDYERAAGWLAPGRVCALALNTLQLEEAEARRAIEHETQRLGLPVTDPVRYGAEPLSVTLVRRMEERRRSAASSEALALTTRFAFTIAHGSHQAYENTLVRIEHDGVEGIGEAAPSHYYGESAATVREALAAWAPHLGDDPFALDAIDARLDAVLEGHGAARAGLEMALHDWIGKKLGLPLWKLFGLDRARSPLSCVTLGMADPAEMERKLATVREFPMIKVKLGGPGDVENLRRVRAGFAGRLQVDANAAWAPADAVRVLHVIAPLGIELVEQPVARGDLDGLGWVRDRSPIPVFADESCHHLADVGRLAGRVDGINLKLMKTGGLREMRRMIHAARAHGMKILLGSMVESSLALSAAAQLAPLADYLDLDGHWLLAADPFDGAPGDRGVIALSERPGLGVVPVRMASPA